MGASRHRRRRPFRAGLHQPHPPGRAHAHRYRVAAISTGCFSSRDIIVADDDGNTFLMAPANRRLAPLDTAERDALGMFYEPAADFDWHTLADLRHRFYDV
ncbi:MAG TPA: hypothetical protein PK593_06595 [Thermomicrobiales bacterium]|jgi:hypothetical protein|nr:hypothetical protein [Chloroflexota bacterium]HQX63111.1 hypothetical protein [Thermomicrobiales bacterium]HBY47396.1 hypothetical protein [Chloroflexota bacterium]HCG29680.1 hypothetical protein [Chloroflexota bacterium]HQZ89818.1 hypothetical protein [Thermomicrobiales bacterium]